MAKYTENFNLIKPEDDEYYDVADFNENMDIIDAELGAVTAQANSAEIADKIGQPADTVLNTVFGKLNGFISADGQGVRIIKSIQRVKETVNGHTSPVVKTYPINPVDASRSIVIMERMGDGDSTSRSPTVEYTFDNTGITISYYFSPGYSVCLGFWIIEFY